MIVLKKTLNKKRIFLLPIRIVKSRIFSCKPVLNINQTLKYILIKQLNISFIYVILQIDNAHINTHSIKMMRSDHKNVIISI